MSIAVPSDFDVKARMGLEALLQCGELATEVGKAVDGFFDRNKNSIRTPMTEAFIAGLFLDHLSTAADSQPEAQPPTRKVA